MSSEDHDRFMDLALEEGRKGELEGNVPVGSVIVRNDEVIGRGRNETRSGPDATAHAEVQAIRDACHRENTCDLTGATPLHVDGTLPHVLLGHRGGGNQPSRSRRPARRNAEIR